MGIREEIKRILWGKLTVWNEDEVEESLDSILSIISKAKESEATTSPPDVAEAIDYCLYLCGEIERKSTKKQVVSTKKKEIEVDSISKTLTKIKKLLEVKTND